MLTLFICSSFSMDLEKGYRFVVAFGSCNKSHLPQPLWKDILNDRPDVWIWGGDNVYANTHSEDTLKAKYDEQLANPGYTALRKNTRIIGTWDDHDFGDNNMGRWNPSKKMSQRLFLDFMEEPIDSPRRKRPGVYTSYLFGEEPNTVKIILLDTRYFMEPQAEDAKLLGESQWQWLEKELKNSKARVHILVSSIQIISPKTQGEQWANYPKEKKRLFSLLEKLHPSSLILLSGDKHYAQMYKKPIEAGNWEVVEATSSGMTHNRNIFKVLGEKIYKLFQPPTLFELNYCLISLDWEKGLAELQIKTQGGKVWKSLQIPL